MRLSLRHLFALDPHSPHYCRFLLGGGDVLVMCGTVQRRWQHCVTRSGGSAASGVAKAVGPRINLTFRRVVQQGRQRS